MRERLELLVNLWTFGVPVVLMTWALLRLTGHARLRYLIAVTGFLAVPATALWSAAVPVAAMAASRRQLELADVAAAPVSIVWFSIATLLLLREAIGHARLRKIRRTLAISDHAAPFTIGLLRPVVVLPADLPERFPAEVIQRIVRHEQSHARWRDPLVFAVLRIIAILFWPSPAWLVLRWVRREREAAADAAALRGARGEEESYIAALLRLARPAPALTADMAGNDLEYRARCLLSPRRGPRLAIAALLAGAFLFSIATPARLDPEEPVVRIVKVHIR